MELILIVYQILIENLKRYFGGGFHSKKKNKNALLDNNDVRFVSINSNDV